MDVPRLPGWGWAALGALGAAGVLAAKNSMGAAAPSGRARPGRAPRDPNNYADPPALVLYPGDPHNGNVTVDSHGVSHTHRTPNGPRYKVAQLPTRSGSFCDWVNSMRMLLARQGLTGQAADFVIAHWDRETGNGRYLWNNSFGNAKQYDQYRPGGAWFRLTDGEPYASYDTADAGVAAQLSLLRSPHYAPAFAKLMAGDPTWYGDLGRLRYYGDANTPEGIEAAAQRGQAQYNALLPNVQACPRS
jgi:hypothetical protein